MCTIGAFLTHYQALFLRILPKSLVVKVDVGARLRIYIRRSVFVWYGGAQFAVHVSGQ